MMDYQFSATGLRQRFLELTWYW